VFELILREDEICTEAINKLKMTYLKQISALPLVAVLAKEQAVRQPVGY